MVVVKDQNSLTSTFDAPFAVAVQSKFSSNHDLNNFCQYLLRAGDAQKGYCLVTDFTVTTKFNESTDRRFRTALLTDGSTSYYIKDVGTTLTTGQSKKSDSVNHVEKVIIDHLKSCIDQRGVHLTSCQSVSDLKAATVQIVPRYDFATLIKEVANSSRGLYLFSRGYSRDRLFDFKDGNGYGVHHWLVKGMDSALFTEYGQLTTSAVTQLLTFDSYSPRNVEFPFLAQDRETLSASDGLNLNGDVLEYASVAGCLMLSLCDIYCRQNEDLNSTQTRLHSSLLVKELFSTLSPSDAGNSLAYKQLEGYSTSPQYETPNFIIVEDKNSNIGTLKLTKSAFNYPKKPMHFVSAQRVGPNRYVVLADPLQSTISKLKCGDIVEITNETPHYLFKPVKVYYRGENRGEKYYRSTDVNVSDDSRYANTRTVMKQNGPMTATVVDGQTLRNGRNMAAPFAHVRRDVGMPNQYRGMRYQGGGVRDVGRGVSTTGFDVYELDGKTLVPELITDPVDKYNIVKSLEERLW